jgi:co-chaperonin GroES (HSP10)
MIATNNFVWIIRDKTEAEKSGLIIPGSGREKPHTGEIKSIGSLVRDKNVKAGKGKKGIFHKGVGQEIDYNGTVYLILFEHEILGVD